jgi:hypothetical protein
MHRKPHFTLLGVPVRLKPIAALPGVLVGALTYALVRRYASQDAPALLLGLASALCWYGTDVVHVAGHITSARLAGAPMDYVSWRIFAINGYYDHDVTPRQHIGRAIGGPIASGLAALLCWLLWRVLGRSLLGRLALIGFIQNAFIALGSLMPIPIIDGGVIYANLRKL